jgi:hypothetical protein
LLVVRKQMNYPQNWPKRILMTADSIGGVWACAVELSRALHRHDIHVLLATMGAALSEDQREEVRRLSNVEVCARPYKLEWMDDPWDEVDAAGEWLLGLEQKFNPDLIHLNGHTHAALDWQAPSLVVGHSCVLSWWRAVKKEAAPARWHEYENRVGRGLKKADLVVAPTHTMLRALEFHYGPLKATKVIPNGRHPGGFAVGRKEKFILAPGGFGTRRKIPPRWWPSRRGCHGPYWWRDNTGTNPTRP